MTLLTLTCDSGADADVYGWQPAGVPDPCEDLSPKEMSPMTATQHGRALAAVTERIREVGGAPVVTDPAAPVTLTLRAIEVEWLESAARRGAGRTTVPGAATELADLADTLRHACEWTAERTPPEASR